MASTTNVRSIATLYAAGLVQALGVVAFPASSTTLRALHHLTDTDYGSIFVPQTIAAILGSLAGGALARRVGLRALLGASIAFTTFAMLFLGVTAFAPTTFVFPLLLSGTACVGFGFGVGAAPMTAYPALLMPHLGASALVTLHATMGVGLAAGPMTFAALAARGQWIFAPLVIGGAALVVAGATAVSTLPFKARASTLASTAGQASLRPGPLAADERRTLAPFVAVVILYALSEGTLSNWAAVFLHEDRHVDERAATFAISAFWSGLTIGRLAVGALARVISPTKIWFALLGLMAVSFVVVPFARDAWSGIAIFAFAGVAVSGALPLTLARANRIFPGREAWISSVLIAALMIGIGSASLLVGALRRLLGADLVYFLSAAYPAIALCCAIIADRRARASA